MTKTPSIKSYDSATTKPIGKSRIEIVGTIPASVWEGFRGAALKRINETVTIDGFRKGMVPESIIVSKVGESTIHEEMAELALSRAYIDIVIDNKIDAISKPEIQVTKLAPGNPLEFKAVTDVMPTVALPDYKKIAADEIKKSSKEKPAEVTDKDVDEAILRIRKAQTSHEGHDHETMSPEEHEKAILDSLPEFNDDFVRGLGDFKDIADFKAKVREMIGENKKDEAREKLRIRIADALAAAATIELPEILIKAELDRTQGQFEQDIERMGAKLDDYLKHAKKTLEDIRKDWIPHAEKKAKLQLVLNAIAAKEDIKPTPEEIEAEVNHIVDHYKEADRERAAVYAETVITNEKIFQFLEK